MLRVVPLWFEQNPATPSPPLVASTGKLTELERKFLLQEGSQGSLRLTSDKLGPRTPAECGGPWLEQNPGTPPLHLMT